LKIQTIEKLLKIATARILLGPNIYLFTSLCIALSGDCIS